MTPGKEIKELIQKIAGTTGAAPTFITAEVKVLGAETCTVERNGVKLTDVRYNAVEDGEANNMIIKPAVGSMVLIADLSGGNYRDLVIISFSKIDSIVINGGSFGGLIKIAELISWMNAVKVDLTAISASLNSLGFPVTITTMAPNKATLENPKIKH